MNLHQLRCFVEVAQELHFGRAAQNLSMMPSALGRHIRLLEESLGTQLLNRTTRSVTLTEDGEDLLREARKSWAKSRRFDCSSATGTAQRTRSCASARSTAHRRG